jgi:flagellar biosynthesis protein FliQ
MFCTLISFVILAAIICGVAYCLWMAVKQIPETPLTWIARLIYWLIVAALLLSLIGSGTIEPSHFAHLIC